MKNTKLIYSGLIILIFSLFSNTFLFAQSEPFIGMTIDEFKKVYPKLESQTYQDEVTYIRHDNIYGLKDEWGYRFKNDSLEWIHFMHFIDDIDSKNFNKSLFAARNLINDYTALYGKPDTMIIGDTTFVDPYEKRHWGYDVIEARWANYKDMKIKVEFDFFGGKGEYHFIFKINYFEKDYPYYD